MAIRPRYLVIGLGTFGHEAALVLASGGAEVIAVDHVQDQVEAVAQHIERAVCCDGADETALDAIGAFEVDAAIVAVGDHFDVTVLATHLLVRRGVQQVLVQVDNARQEDAIRAIGATDVIFPERDSSLRLARRLLTPSLIDQIVLGENAGIIRVPCRPEWQGKSLLQLDLRRRFHVNVIGIQRGDGDGRSKIEVVLDPDRQLDDEDLLLCCGRSADLERLREQTASHGHS